MNHHLQTGKPASHSATPADSEAFRWPEALDREVCHPPSKHEFTFEAINSPQFESAGFDDRCASPEIRYETASIDDHPWWNFPSARIMRMSDDDKTRLRPENTS